MRRSNELKLGDAIQKFLETHKLEEKFLETEVYARWEELAGGSINLKTTKLILRNGELVVFLSSSVLRQELNLRKSGILEKINMRLRGKGVIKELTFR